MKKFDITEHERQQKERRYLLLLIYGTGLLSVSFWAFVIYLIWG